MRILRRLTRDEHVDPRDVTEESLIEFEDDDGNIHHGRERKDGALVSMAMVVPGPTLSDELADNATKAETEAEAARVASDRRAELREKIKGGSLTATEIQEALRFLL